MFRIRFLSLAAAVCCLWGLSAPVLAAQVDCDTVYCFTAEDFAGEEPLAGICITALPDPRTGTVFLGSRVLRPGDILTAGQLEDMTFAPLRTQEDREAAVTYLPIYQDRVAGSAVATLSIRGKEDKAPVAQDSAMETYKNLPNDGALKVSDPEGQAVVYTVLRQPRRGAVTIREDGSFTYTPKKNKVGVDSFTFTATDPAGNVSREATVTVQILRPTDAQQYTDTLGQDCRFAAEWMKNTGLFVGERISGEHCFYPEKTVSRGEFLTMVTRMLDIPMEEADREADARDVPQWLKPYLAAALRSGLTAGLPDMEDVNAPITGGEAAVILQNALDLSVSGEKTVTEEAPAWAANALEAMNGNGVKLKAEEKLTRGQAAQVLYRASRLAPNAPGTAVFRIGESRE